jgi:hypothetical protein
MERKSGDEMRRADVSRATMSIVGLGQFGLA